MIAVRTSTTQAAYSRRAILRKLGASAAMIPLLHGERARAATTPGGAPKRIITMAMTNGVVNSDFYAADDSRPTDSYILAPLAKWSSKILVPAAIDARSMGDAPDNKFGMGAGHGTFPCMYTGGCRGIVGSDPFYFSATFPSIHKIISDALRTKVTVRMPILDCAVHPGDLVWLAPGQRNTPERDPNRLFDRMFASPVATPDQLVSIRARRKSVLDALRAELTAFQGRLGTEDRSKLDTHLASVRELELQLAMDSPSGASCQKPETRPGYGAVYNCGDAKFEPATKAFNSLIALAIRCDLTRVVNHPIGYDLGSCPDPVIDGKGYNYHGIAHSGSGSYATKRVLDRYFFGLLADFLEKLDAIAEPGGTALDHSVVVLINDMQDGASHWCGGLPTVMAGSCGGYFKTGRVVRLGSWAGKPPKYVSGTSGVPHNKLLAELCNAMDVPTDKVGSYSGTLPELRA